MSHHQQQQNITVLMVAEKPSICTAVAHALHRLSPHSDQQLRTRGRTPPVHEFSSVFLGQPALFRVTSVTGHVFSTDFPAKYQNWDAIDPIELFSAPVLRVAEGKGGIVKHLEREGRGVDYLVLWLDCDREGENICFEVISCVCPLMKQPQQQHRKQQQQTVFRARFSAVTAKDIERAMRSLTAPNEHEALAVDARQELDLKIGVAFSRFQTRYFQGKYGNLDSAVISYGPCQTPTLGFCVDRYDEIQTFKPKAYWCIDAALEVRGRILELDCDRGRMFDKQTCDSVLAQLSQSNTIKEVICKDVKTTETRKQRPQALNTVELLKIASRTLGIGPQATMRAAEQLYLCGFLSYPRTESTAYPSSFDFREVLLSQRAHRDWGAYAAALLKDNNNNNNNSSNSNSSSSSSGSGGGSRGFTAARAGHDAGDHPPITPVDLAQPHELSGDSARIYELVVRHFLASISPDALFYSTKAKFLFPTTAAVATATATTIAGSILQDNNSIGGSYSNSSRSGGETFTLSGRREKDAGFLRIYGNCYHNNRESDPDNPVELPELEVGRSYRIASLKSRQGVTAAPGYLTESDLIEQMEKHRIGTDASIPTHINNIIVRNYVQLGQVGRTLVPTQLGIVLVHGYQRIDPQLVLPDTRAAIEASCDKIARGTARKETVVQQALATFEGKFEHFRTHIGAMNSLFEATFSPLAATGKNLGKCGRCNRYMRYIPLRPQRLYCPTCHETYALPQNGTIKLYKELKCPLDAFELVLFSLGNSEKAQGKSYPLCPCCYNHPPQFVDPPTATTTATATALEEVTSTTTALTATLSTKASSTATTADAGSKADTADLNALSQLSLKASTALPPVPPSIDATTTAAKTTTAALLDIEEHRGVWIKRRIKEGIQQSSTTSTTTAITSAAATAMTTTAATAGRSATTVTVTNSGDSVGGSSGTGGSKRDDIRRRGGGRKAPSTTTATATTAATTTATTTATTAAATTTAAAAAKDNGEEGDGEVDNIYQHMGCNQCEHPTCKHSAIFNGICRCPSIADNSNSSSTVGCSGMLVLDVNSKPNWKLACNQCNTLIRFRSEIHLITPQPQIPCPECGVTATAVFEFNKAKSPLPGGQTTLVGCIVCNDFLNSITEVVEGRSVNLQVIRQERYRRGAGGRGRKGRGRGRSNGRGSKGDVKMSFSDF